MPQLGLKGATSQSNPAVRARAQSISEIARDPQIELQLANDARLSVAESLVHLRRHRNLTQAKLARRMKTSQAAIGRIERASENITLKTLEKAVKALKGRLALSISPVEIYTPQLPPWWELTQPFHSAQPFSLVKACGTSDGQRVAAGWVTVTTGENVAAETVALAAQTITQTAT